VERIAELVAAVPVGVAAGVISGYWDSCLRLKR